MSANFDYWPPGENGWVAGSSALNANLSDPRFIYLVRNITDFIASKNSSDLRPASLLLLIGELAEDLYASSYYPRLTLLHIIFLFLLTLLSARSRDL